MACTLCRQPTLTVNTSDGYWQGHRRHHRLCPVFGEPVVHGLTGDAIPASRLGHRRAGDDFHDRVVPLLHDAQLHEDDPVRAENLVHGSEQQSCSSSRPVVMITDHVPAIRLPPDHAGRRMAAAVPAQGGVEDRRDLDPAPPARRAATAAARPPERDLGGPGPARGPARRDTQRAAPGLAATGHPGHDPALAPRHRPPPLGRQVHARQDRPASDPPEHQGPGPPAGPREPRAGATVGSTASWPAWE